MFCLSVLNVDAQLTNSAYPTLPGHGYNHPPYFPSQVGLGLQHLRQHVAHHDITANKGAGVSSRLVAESFYEGIQNGTFALIDSHKYSYPNVFTNAYTQDDRFIGIDTQIYVDSHNFYVYDGSGHLIRGYWLNDIYDSMGRGFYTYNSSGGLIENYTQTHAYISSWENGLRDVYTLDSNNRITEDNYQEWNASINAWATLQDKIYVLNAQGNRTQALDKEPDQNTQLLVNAYRSDVLYDTSGVNPIEYNFLSWNKYTSSWDTINRYIMTLNALGKPSQMDYQLYTAHAYAPEARYLYTYDNNGNDTANETETYNLNTNSFDKIFKTVFTYNSYNQIVTEISLQWLPWMGAYGIVANNTGQWNYYYDTYINTGVVNTLNFGATLNLFPLPANNDIIIGLKWDIAQSYNAYITDMAGKIITPFSGSLAKEFRTTISVKDFPAGNYLLYIKGSGGGSASRMISVVH